MLGVVVGVVVRIQVRKGSFGFGVVRREGRWPRRGFGFLGVKGLVCGVWYGVG